MIAGVAVVGWIIAGAASAFGGWTFHHFVKAKQTAAVKALELRVKALES